MAEKLSVLLIEDDIYDVEAVERAFRTVQPAIFALTHVTRFRDGIRAIGEATFHVIILDLGLPDSVGLNGVERLMELAPNIPVIVLTGMNDEETALRGIELGAQEFLDKNSISPPMLIRYIRQAAKRKQFFMNRLSATHNEVKSESSQIMESSEKLARLIEETSQSVCKQTESLLGTALSDGQRSLVSSIQEMSERSAKSGRRLAAKGQPQVASRASSNGKVG